MRLISFLVILLISTPNFAITWGTHSLMFNGERPLVMALTNDVKKMYSTYEGELAINCLGPKSTGNRIVFPVYHESNSGIEYEKNDDIYLLKIDHSLIGNSELRVMKLFGVFKAICADFNDKANTLNKEKFIQELDAENSAQESDFSSLALITVKASIKKKQKMMKALRDISRTQIGAKLFSDMSSCSKKLLIYDDKSALSGGGYTGATRSGSHVFDGRGIDAYIRFRFDQPVEGAHMVGAIDGSKIEFTYIDNIYHELVHAKHIMCGTMEQFASEAQAIVEENNFRKEREETKDWPARDPREYEHGQQVWFGYSL